MPERQKDEWPQWLSRRLAAEYLQQNFGLCCQPQTLANYATEGNGPRFRRQGNRLTIYERGDLDTWAAQKVSKPVTSTSQLREVAA